MIEFECSCGLAFEDIAELNEHKLECPVHKKKIMRGLPPHQGKQAIVIGVKDVIKKKKVQDGSQRKSSSNQKMGEAEETNRPGTEENSSQE